MSFPRRSILILGLIGLLHLSSSGTLAAEGATPPTGIREINAALKLTEREKQILATVRDGSKSVEENGFYMMMAKISAFPALGPEALRELDAPAIKNLTRDPDRYRYRPMRLNIRVFYVMKLSVKGKTISSNPYWPSEKPMWEIHGTGAEGPPSAAGPLIVYSAIPPPNLPEADTKRPDGRLAYQKGPRYVLAGIFYKYIEGLDTGDEATKQQRKYPVVLAWEMRKLSQGPIKGPVNWILPGAIFLGLVLGVVVFVFLKRYIRRDKRRRDGLMFSHYRPLREAPARRERKKPARRERKSAPQDTGETDTQVDPDLIAAAAEYRPPGGSEKNPPGGSEKNPLGGSEEQPVNEKEGQ